MKLLSKFWLGVLGSAIGLDALAFQPQIISGAEHGVCEVVRQHYEHLFNSDNLKTQGITTTDDVHVPEFEVTGNDETRKYFYTAEVNFYGQKKVMLFYQRPFNWRGNAHSGYLLLKQDVEQVKETLIDTGQSPNHYFFPCRGDIQDYKEHWSWWFNKPFQHQERWYSFEEYGDFHRDDGLRKVYLIDENMTSKEVCNIKIFKSFDEDVAELPVFAAYKKSTEAMLVSPGDCGTSTPEVHAKWRGRYFASLAAIRPWALKLTWQHDDYQWNQNKYESQAKHLHNWQFTDVWSQREYAVYENLKLDAERELTQYYTEKFSYKPDRASRLANDVIKGLPSSYYSLAVFNNEDKDFTGFAEMLNGTFDGWGSVKELMALKYGEQMDIAALTLMIDTPELYENLPKEYHPDNIKTFYGKNLLMFAAHMNNYDAVEYLLSKGWAVNAVTKLTEQSFCRPVLQRVNRSALTYAAENASVYLMQRLIDAGADITVKDSQGNGLDFYLQRNPRLSDDEKSLSFKALLKRYNGKGKPRPSFNCDVKLNVIESAICDNEGLAIYDQELNSQYQSLRGIPSVAAMLPKSQIAWLRRRNSECMVFSEEQKLNGCIARLTRARIRYLEYLSASAG